MQCAAIGRKAGGYQAVSGRLGFEASGQDWEELGLTIGGRSLVIGESAPFSPLVFNTCIRLHTSSICSKTFLFLLTRYSRTRVLIAPLTRGELKRA
jgi:hypothetical protein